MKLIKVSDWRLLTIFTLLLCAAALTMLSLTTDMFARSSIAIFSWTDKLRAFADQYILASTASYFVIYVVAILLCIPLLAAMSVIGGYLFGFKAVLLVGFACAVGATLFLIFLGYRFHHFIDGTAMGNRLASLQGIYARSPLLWVFAMRLIPLFPFWIVTVAAGMFKTRPTPFFLGTFLGTLPGTLLYVWFGQGLSSLTVIDQKIDISDLLSESTIVPALSILGLTIISAIVARRL